MEELNMSDFFSEMMGQYTGDPKYDKFGYHCTRCKYEMGQIVVQTPLKVTKKLFYCEHKGCPVFGMLTVVAVKKSKG